MEDTDLYLLPEDYEIAEKNGISKANAYNRFYNLGWDKQRSITQPIHRPESDRVKWRRIAVQNGIPETTYHSRISKRMGWPLEKAATTPKIPGPERAKIGMRNRQRLMTDEQIEIARKNGISRGTASHRIRQYKWPVEKAITEPVNTQYRKKSYKPKKEVK